GLLGLLLRTNPQERFSNAEEWVTWWTAPPCAGLPAAGFPPSLKPLPSPCGLLLPLKVLPLEKAQQLSITTTSLAAKKSQPSSALFQARQPRNTLPGPIRRLGANPSAFSPPVAVSRLPYESQLRIVLYAPSALLALSASGTVICRPVSPQS